MGSNEDLRFRRHPLVTAVAARLPLPESTAEEGVETPSLAERMDVADLSLFAGFLGAEIERPGATWWLFYLDSRLHRWLLVPRDDIVVYKQLDDDTAFDKKRDVLWVDADARLLQGSGSQTIEGLFLVGEFTRAGDFAATTATRTSPASTGLICEATTPSCYCFSSRTR
jgi:hypothetical protein